MSKSKLVLGKGLGALIPSVTEVTEKPVSIRPTSDTVDDGSSVGILAHIDVGKIRPNPYQPRMEFDPQTLTELARSIQQKGLIQPITVRRYRNGEYQLISGERRVRACIEAKIQFIPAYIIRISSKEEMLELALIENIQRDRLNPIEIANSYQILIDECHYTQDQIAERVGKDRSTVANFIRLLKLPEEIRASLVSNDISMGHARALITIPRQKDQLALWKRILKNRLSVRKVERMVQLLGDPASKESARGKSRTVALPAEAAVEEVLTRLKTRFATRIRIRGVKRGKGSVEIEFYSIDDFNRIIDLLLAQK